MKQVAKDVTEQVAREYRVAINDGSLLYAAGCVTFDMKAMPVLPFFLALAERLDVPMEQMSVRCRAYPGSGCPTCGVGAELEVEVTVKLAQDYAELDA